MKHGIPALLAMAFLFLTSPMVVAQPEILQDAPQQRAYAQAGSYMTIESTAEDLLEALDQTFDSLTAVSDVKGFNAAILFPDGTLWKRAAGVSQELPTPVALTTDDLIGTGSATKSFVSVTILRLYEEGFLSLDDSIGKYLDPYPNVPPTITIRQLLGHRSGMEDYLNPLFADVWFDHPDSLWSADTMLAYHIPAPGFTPGAQWAYSNTNYLVAGHLIEEVTGQPWQQVIRELVLDSMGLSSTYVYPFESIGNETLSHAWFDEDGDGQVDDLQGNGISMAGLSSMAHGAGCMVSTPEDLAHFSQQLYGGSFLQPATLAEMQTDYQNDPQGGTSGLGTIGSTLLGKEAWGHSGHLFYRATADYFPNEQVTFVLQQNDTREGDNVVDIYDLYPALFNVYLQFTAATSLDDESFANKVNIFPNPTSDYLTIELSDKPSQEGTFELHTSTGQLLVADAMDQHQSAYSIDLTEFPAGMYFLTLNIGDQSAKKAFLIRR